MVSKQEWTLNRQEKLEAILSEYLARQPDSQLGALLKDFLAFGERAHPRAKAAKAFDFASLNTLLRTTAMAIAVEDCERFQSARPVLEPGEVISAACENIERAMTNHHAPLRGPAR
jgi:hypothetical protein